METYGLEGLSPSEVSDAIVDEVFGRAAWDRLYAKGDAIPLTQDDREDFAIMTGLEGQALDDWISANYPATPKAWQFSNPS